MYLKNDTSQVLSLLSVNQRSQSSVEIHLEAFAVVCKFVGNLVFDRIFL